jgi:hypothetical protein
MTFRLVHSSTALPASFICDPSVEFQPGMIAELTTRGNQIMATVSNGTAPLGIIDEIKTKAFTSVSWNETVILSCVGVPGPGGKIVLAADIKYELRKANIIANTFQSTVNVLLNPINGVITFIAGTELNFDLAGTGTPDAIKAIVCYTYYVPNIPGDDSTQGSGRMTVWYNRMFFQTDQFETNQQYPLRANLFVSEAGLLTTRKPSNFHPCVALVTAPPSPMIKYLECFWL